MVASSLLHSSSAWCKAGPPSGSHPAAKTHPGLPPAERAVSVKGWEGDGSMVPEVRCEGGEMGNR